MNIEKLYQEICTLEIKKSGFINEIIEIGTDFLVLVTKEGRYFRGSLFVNGYLIETDFGGEHKTIDEAIDKVTTRLTIKQKSKLKVQMPRGKFIVKKWVRV